MQLLDVLRGFAIFGMFAVNMGVDNWGPETRAVQLAMPDFLILVLLLFYKCSPRAILVVAVLCFGLEAFTVLVPKYQASLEIEFLAAEPDVVAVSMSPRASAISLRVCQITGP